jgi:hypothetical protein
MCLLLLIRKTGLFVREAGGNIGTVDSVCTKSKVVSVCERGGKRWGERGRGGRERERERERELTVSRLRSCGVPSKLSIFCLLSSTRCFIPAPSFASSSWLRLSPATSLQHVKVREGQVVATNNIDNHDVSHL